MTLAFIQDSRGKDSESLSRVVVSDAEDVIALEREIRLLEEHLTSSAEEHDAFELHTKIRKHYVLLVESIASGFLAESLEAINKSYRAIAKALGAVKRLCESARISLLKLNEHAALLAACFVLILAYLQVHRAQALILWKASEAACLRIPLFEYGPELCERRHRHR